MTSSKQKKFITIREMLQVPFLGLTRQQVSRFCQRRFRGTKKKVSGQHNQNCYDKHQLLDQIQVYYVERYDLTTIKDLSRTSQWRQHQLHKPDMTRLLKSEHMKGIVYRLGRKLEYHFKADDFWSALESHRAEAKRNKQVAAEKARNRRDKDSFQKMGDKYSDGCKIIPGTCFNGEDLRFFRSWNKRRPEKFKIDLKKFSIMGRKLKKSWRGRYITCDDRTDLSDIWYSSEECKALQDQCGSSVGVVHFLNVVNWK